MLHLMICDDEPTQTDLLELYVREWAAVAGAELCVDTCRNADQFFFLWDEKKDIDILLLDIDMPGMDGLSLARTLRRNGVGLQILFITGLSEYALEGYDVEAVSYLIKPVKKDKLFAGLERAWERSKSTDAVLLLEAAGEVSRVNCKDICYLESDGHDTLVYCNRNHVRHVVRSKIGLQHLENEIEKKSNMFFRLHRSYLVNLYHIQKITRKEVFVDIGDVIPIARGKWERLNQAYLKFYRGMIECSD